MKWSCKNDIDIKFYLEVNQTNQFYKTPMIVLEEYIELNTSWKMNSFLNNELELRLIKSNGQTICKCDIDSTILGLNQLPLTNESNMTLGMISFEIYDGMESLQSQDQSQNNSSNKSSLRIPSNQDMRLDVKDFYGRGLINEGII